MTKLYHINTLTVTDITPKGIEVDGGEHGILFLQDAPVNTKVGDEIRAYLHPNAFKDDVVATMDTDSYLQIGECANLEVVGTSENGVYLDWGLPKDLFLPASEQAYYVDDGDFCVVYVSTDAQDRPMASSKLSYHLDEQRGALKDKEAVDLLIADETDLGFKAVINNKQLGLIYHNDLSQPLQLGMRMTGWVKGTREDGKINLNINALDSESRDQLEEIILNAIKVEGGKLELSDKSPPEDIFNKFKVSKKNFKRALGSLYKQRLIKVSPEYIEIIKDEKTE